MLKYLFLKPTKNSETLKEVDFCFKIKNSRGGEKKVNLKNLFKIWFFYLNFFPNELKLFVLNVFVLTFLKNGSKIKLYLLN